MSETRSSTRTNDTRARLTEAAFDLFEADGFENTTVEQIVARAGVSKTTFFRYFRAKEDVVFPDHQRTIADITTMFEVASGEDRLNTVYLAAKHVMSRYVAEGEVASRRFRLTSSVPALRSAEVTSIQSYHRLFRDYLSAAAPEDWQHRLTAEIQAASVIAANNFVIRRWLRGEIEDPLNEFDRIQPQLLAMCGGGPAGGSAVVVLRSDRTPEDLIRTISAALKTE